MSPTAAVSSAIAIDASQDIQACRFIAPSSSAWRVPFRSTWVGSTCGRKMQHTARSRDPTTMPEPLPDRSTLDETAIARFERSLLIDYEQWHDGVGYDVAVLRELSDQQRRGIEARLTPPDGWRDIEALAVLASLGSDSARAELRRVATSG